MSSPPTRNAVDSTRTDVGREFFVSVELYLSPKAASGLRKPLLRKKPEKRESIRQPSGTDETQKKLKEKSSWLNIGRGLPTAGQWRSATCKLSEEEEGCLLNIYIDETILHQSIYVYRLSHTDIRPVDRSLFDRKDCIVIQCIQPVPGQRWSANPVNEPTFLSFLDTDSFNTWTTLLRSYATPEVYGQRYSSDEGGLYRMWRQIEVNCVQGRNLGATRTEGALPPGTPDSFQEGETADSEVFCEIYMNDMLVGRTTVKKGIGAPEWQEGFVIPDLPPFENLEVVVLKEKRGSKTSVLGTVLIILGNFRRGEYVEGWFPVLDNTAANVSNQVGELKLKVRADEEIILPNYEYSGMLQALESRNYLDWMNELGTQLQLKDVSCQFIAVAVAMNSLVKSVCDLANREVDDTPSPHNTLFRGNTVLTKTIELSMAWYGKAFLEASIGGVIRRIYNEKVSIEVDPVRSGRNTKDIEKNVELLVYWCKEFWGSIYTVRGECPPEMRKLFEHIRKLVEKRCRLQDQETDQPSNLPWQSVSAFCFLRFIVPAILHPHLFGLVLGLPDLPVQRSLTLIAKVIQSLANLNPAVQKEEFMRGVKDFLTSSRAAMIDYIIVVSSPRPDVPASNSSADRYNRMSVLGSLRQRRESMSLLSQEAIPMLPYLLDVPRHLSLISSAVIRRSRGYNGESRSEPLADPCVVEFCAKCYEVEERALKRVTQLAGYTSHDQSRRRPSTANVRVTSPTAIPPPPRSPRTSQSPGAEKRMRAQSIPRLNPRPFTAPSPSDILPALPVTQSPVTTTSSQVDLPSESPRARPYLHTMFASAGATTLRRVQTVETSSPTGVERDPKRKIFFRAFRSKK